MKRIAGRLAALFAALCIFLVPHSMISAAADVVCTADPPAGPVGTDFHLACRGYTPNRYVYAYLVEPSGAAGQLFNQSGAIKVDEQGAVTYTVESRLNDDQTLMTGTWHFVAEELGLSKSVVHRGEVTFRITGGIEGVSGASLDAEPSTIHKPLQAYVHTPIPQGSLNELQFSDPVTLRGSGFLSGEPVTFWLEPAGGGCASLTRHLNSSLGSVVPGVGALFVRSEVNVPIFDGLGAQGIDTVKASSDGAVSLLVRFTSLACQGKWHLVARGMTSHRGGDAWVNVAGNSISTSASLSADPGIVGAMFDRVRFRGEGFGANEHVSCWLTTPQGSALGFPDELQVTGSNGGAFVRNQPILSDGAGRLSFEMVTGSVFAHEAVTLIIGGVTQRTEATFLDPTASEGALGEYAMSCHGDASGANAIARFRVTGAFVDP